MRSNHRKTRRGMRSMANEIQTSGAEENLIVKSFMTSSVESQFSIVSMPPLFRAVSSIKSILLICGSYQYLYDKPEACSSAGMTKNVCIFMLRSFNLNLTCGEGFIPIHISVSHRNENPTSTKCWWNMQSRRNAYLICQGTNQLLPPS